MLKILYETFPGRVILKFLTNRKISELVGSYMDSKYSKWLIPIFMKMNHINPDEYIDETYENFNDCFSRHIKPELLSQTFHTTLSKQLSAAWVWQTCLPGIHLICLRTRITSG